MGIRSRRLNTSLGRIPHQEISGSYHSQMPYTDVAAGEGGVYSVLIVILLCAGLCSERFCEMYCAVRAFGFVGNLGKYRDGVLYQPLQS